MTSRTCTCLAVAVVGLLLATAPAPAQSRHGALFRPEDLGLLESADRDTWQKPEQIMDSLGIADGSQVADVGAGGGWFTVRLARRVGPNGMVWAEDVQAEMLEAVRRRAAKENLRNVETRKGSATDPMLPAGSLDAVLIVEAFQEIQSANPQLFLENLYARRSNRAGVSASWTTRRPAAARGPTRPGRIPRRSCRWRSAPGFVS